VVGPQPVELRLDELGEAVLRLKLVKRLELVCRMIHDAGDIENEVGGGIKLSCHLNFLLEDMGVSTGLTIHFINYYAS
jgi:hypothetical protein